ncbi:MAG: hypothetical protein HFH33_06530 [Eubacterium sp.]|nr:hypothetical protein [Eubacterium sp.]
MTGMVFQTRSGIGTNQMEQSKRCSVYFCNTYEEQPGEGMGMSWRRLWKNG